MKFIIALNKQDKRELDENNFKFVMKENMNDEIIYIYENNIDLLENINKQKYLFSNVLFV